MTIALGFIAGCGVAAGVVGLGFDEPPVLPTKSRIASCGLTGSTLGVAGSSPANCAAFADAIAANTEDAASFRSALLLSSEAAATRNEAKAVLRQSPGNASAREAISDSTADLNNALIAMDGYHEMVLQTAVAELSANEIEKAQIAAEASAWNIPVQLAEAASLQEGGLHRLQSDLRIERRATRMGKSVPNAVASRLAAVRGAQCTSAATAALNLNGSLIEESLSGTPSEP